MFCAAIASQSSYGYFVVNDKGKSRDGLISIFKMRYDNASLFHCKMRSVGYSTPGQTISFLRRASSEGLRPKDEFLLSTLPLPHPLGPLSLPTR